VATPAVMLMGTGSSVGKSTLVAGLCRSLARRGLRVLPFKPQNMSNNAAACPDGGEIGRAQALQARAAGVTPTVHMNPVLLKPETETGAQVIVQGRRVGSLKAMDYGQRKAELLPAVLDSFARLEAEADIVIVEGAGSPAEVNLRRGDIANMGFATAADVPVVMVGDIDRGGVIASLVGTHALLPEAERRLIRGFAINRFRGDVRLFDGGMAEIAARTGWAGIGIVPWFADASRLPAEDALDLARPQATRGRCVIAVPVLRRIANFDDLDPFRQEPDVDLRLVQPGEPIPAEARLVMLPGSKSTIGDLAFLREQGWDVDLAAHVRRGGRVLGLCGGYQMLGRTVSDPDGLEGPPQTVPGLGLLDVETVLSGEKITRPVAGIHIASDKAIAGYEIHLGRTDGPDCTRPMLHIDGRPDGAARPDGRVQGCYVHGVFAADGFRARFLSDLSADSALAYETRIEATLDALADHCERHLDVEAIIAIARSRGR
jgi:adenosylcobyric acid synthase